MVFAGKDDILSLILFLMTKIPFTDTIGLRHTKAPIKVFVSPAAVGETVHSFLLAAFLPLYRFQFSQKVFPT